MFLCDIGGGKILAIFNQGMGRTFSYTGAVLKQISHPPPDMSDSILRLETTVACVVSNVAHVFPWSGMHTIPPEKVMKD